MSEPLITVSVEIREVDAVISLISGIDLNKLTDEELEKLKRALLFKAANISQRKVDIKKAPSAKGAIPKLSPKV